ncbi:hypothetical protein Tco_0645164, partial [Tanacetum coccineum]
CTSRVTSWRWRHGCGGGVAMVVAWLWWWQDGVGCGDDGGMTRMVVRGIGGGGDGVCGVEW